MKPVFRDALPADAPFLYKCLEGLAEHEDFELKMSFGQMEEMLFHAKDQNVFTLIACDEDKPVGMAIWSKRFSPYSGGFNLLLIDLYVEPFARGKGIGKEFFSAFEAVCERHDLKKIEFFVNAENSRAQKFYGELGFNHQTYSQHWGKWMTKEQVVA